MNRERLYRSEAIILKRSNLGEADRLLTLYTPHRGKHRVTAKGVRRPTSRKAGHLELFTHARLFLAKGRTLDIVTQAETISAFPRLRTDLSRTSSAYYLVELLDRFTGEEIANPPLFDLLLQALAWLNDEPDVEPVLRFYELRLLGLVGYQPQLFRCVRCSAVISPQINYFSISDGGVVCPRCAQQWTESGLQRIAVNPLKVMRFFQTHSFVECRQIRLSPEIWKDVENIMLRYITYYLERNLKSIEFIHHLRRPIEATAEVAPTNPFPTAEER